MKMSRVSIAILFASVLLMVTMIPSGLALPKGPREDDMVIYFYGSQEAAYNAMSVGSIDFVIFDLTPSQADLAFTNPNIVTVKVPDSGFYEFDLNNNYSVNSYPGIRSPMNYAEMRQAIAFCSDKDTYIDSILGGKAQRIDQMISAPTYGWANETMSYPYYPYEFSTLAASLLLDTMFPQNTSQPNPDYNAGIPGSTLYLRNYPDTHPQKAHKVLDPLIVCVRNEHTPRLQAGRLCYANMQAIGIPCDVNENPMSVLKPIVMDIMDYHFYTGGWSTGRFPPLTLYGLYHSINAFPLGSNYVTGHPVPTYPYLDQLLYQCNYALSYAAAVAACKLAAGYMTELCVNVPLWSVASYWGWSTSLLGVVNLQGDDPENGYSFMNAYKIDGSPIRCGAINPPNAMNMVYSSWVYDFNNLDRMNLGGGVDIPGYNVAADQAGFVTAWNTTTWEDVGRVRFDNLTEPDDIVTPGSAALSRPFESFINVTINNATDSLLLTEDVHYNFTDNELYIFGYNASANGWYNASDPTSSCYFEVYYYEKPTKTLIEMEWRHDAYFTKPISGDPGENVNASHYYWNSWLEFQVGDGWGSTSFIDLHHIDIDPVDPYSFDIYFDTLSYWNTYYCQYYLKPMDTWMAQGENFLNSTVETFVNPTTPGDIDLDNAPIWFDYVKFNDVPLTFIDDYNIVLGDLYINSALGAGTLEVSYWYIPTPTALRGYVPGAPAIGWQTIFEGAGMYYCTAFTPSLGGSATYKRSSWYYMVTPLLGEIDFAKKPNGNYKIDVFDLAFAGGAYGSQGTGINSVNWFPGADLAPPGGVIDILDVTTVAGANWDKEFDPNDPYS